MNAFSVQAKSPEESVGMITRDWAFENPGSRDLSVFSQLHALHNATSIQP